MFYEEAQINSFLKCKQCKKRLDKPNMLPWYDFLIIKGSREWSTHKKKSYNGCGF